MIDETSATVMTSDLAGITHAVQTENDATTVMTSDLEATTVMTSDLTRVMRTVNDATRVATNVGRTVKPEQETTPSGSTDATTHAQPGMAQEVMHQL